ncbi:hypothetical protein [Liquorilactobacillus mali]|uniref:Uncharacterized protein n=1 Tax=Liquorilactobacillus mali KCTC 3596 = DSM 20444 TaxID=1046596 RepID=A0A0R2EBE8_9LACO|nr:hypothetical protein [Liquorilactobacillus mali]KRN09357.1 hypothetical protein FD00_GL001080 [Liquorilactobacillus mali KCTC 3596 = DSM 20444]
MKRKYNIGDLVRITTTAKDPMNYLSGTIVDIRRIKASDDNYIQYKVKIPTSFGFHLGIYGEENLIFVKRDD